MRAQTVMASRRSKLLAALLLLPLAATAAPVTITNVYDGDTFTIEAALVLVYGDETTVIDQSVSVRVDGVDTPEIRGKCDEEKALALEAKQFAEQWLAAGPVELRNIRQGKYAGRVVAEVWRDGERLSAALVNAGLGRVYDGRRRDGWCGG